MDEELDPTTVRKEVVNNMANDFERIVGSMDRFYKDYEKLTRQERLLIGGFVFSGTCPERNININIINTPVEGVLFFYKRIVTVLKDLMGEK